MIGQQSCYRSGVNNVTFCVLCEQDGNENMDSMNDPPKIHPYHPLPISQRAFPCCTSSANPGIVEKQVHSPEGSQGLLRQRFHVFNIGHICFHSHHSCTFGFQLLFCLIQGRLLNIRQDHFHPLLDAALSDGTSDTARRTCDHCNFVLEVVHGYLP